MNDPTRGTQISHAPRGRSLWDSVTTLQEASEEAIAELAHLSQEITVARIALRRAQDSRAWRLGHGIAKLLGPVTAKRHLGETPSALDTAIEELEATERHRS